jgi:hypothetical protein
VASRRQVVLRVEQWEMHTDSRPGAGGTSVEGPGGEESGGEGWWPADLAACSDRPCLSKGGREGMREKTRKFK